MPAETVASDSLRKDLIDQGVAIRTEELTKVYEMGAEQVYALRGINIEIKRGEYVAIMGPSGSGKSTLMNLIGCLDTPTSGKYWLAGRLVSDLDEDELGRARIDHIVLDADRPSIRDARRELARYRPGRRLQQQRARGLRDDHVIHGMAMPAGLPAGRETPLGHLHLFVVDLHCGNGGGTRHQEPLTPCGLRSRARRASSASPILISKPRGAGT